MLKIGIGMALFGVVMVGRWLHSLGPGYTTNKEGVHFYYFDNTDWKRKTKAVKLADAASFRKVKGGAGRYGKDHQRVYFEATDLRDADPATFRVLDWRATYSRDAETVFWASIPVSLDPEHFEILSNAYAKDRTQVYFGSRPIPGADPATFEVLDSTTGKARDRFQQYVLGRPQNQ